MDVESDEAEADDATIEYRGPEQTEPTRTAPPSSASASGGGTPSPRVEVVAGSGVHLSEETRTLLRLWLRAASLAMTCLAGTLFVTRSGVA